MPATAPTRRFRSRHRLKNPGFGILARLQAPRNAFNLAYQSFRVSLKRGISVAQTNLQPFILLAVVFLILLILFVSSSVVSFAMVSNPTDSEKRLQDTPPLAHAVRSKTEFVPVSSADVRPGVSLVACCMNRHETLRQTLPTWLDLPHVNEIVIVDWSSTTPLIDLVHNVTRDRRVKVIRVENEKDWILSRAYNLAIGATSREDILRTDCDYRIERGFVRAHVLNIESEGASSSKNRLSHFYAGNYNRARNENEVHLNGAMFIRRKDFVQVGGYDERIQTYGWDDEDLYDRLAKAKVEKRDINYDHVKHVAHNDVSRTQRDVKFAQVEIDLNRLVLEHIAPWSSSVSASKDSRERATQWEVIAKDASSRYQKVVAISSPRALQDQVNHTQLNEEWDLALGRRLNNEFQVPWDIMVTMESATKHKLLQRLYDAGTESETNSTRRILFAHVQHGLGNRLRALASAMAFANNTKRVLVVIWEPDAHISAKFSDLFETDLPVMTKFKPSWPFKNHEKFDGAWRSILSFNYQEVEGHGAVKDAFIANIEDKHMYFKSSCIMNTDSALSNWELDSVMLRSLRPVKEVLDQVHIFETGFGLAGRIGVHIRDRTLQRDIDNVNFVSEYGEKPSATMDYWRRKSSYKTFAAEMRKLVHEDPSSKFYVAADTKEVLQYFVKEFPGKILYAKRDCDGRDGHCVRFALIDILALSKTKSLLGSNWSSFTEAAERFGGLKARLAGQDFAVDDQVPVF